MVVLAPELLPPDEVLEEFPPDVLRPLLVELDWFPVSPVVLLVVLFEIGDVCCVHPARTDAQTTMTTIAARIFFPSITCFLLEAIDENHVINPCLLFDFKKISRKTSVPYKESSKLSLEGCQGEP